MADDAVLVVNDLLREHSEYVLFRRSLMEYALEESEYNFDIMLELLKIYDQYGCSISFN